MQEKQKNVKRKVYNNISSHSMFKRMSDEVKLIMQTNRGGPSFPLIDVHLAMPKYRVLCLCTANVFFFFIFWINKDKAEDSRLPGA